MIRKTYNPILRQETYKPNFFAKIPEPGINSAILLIPGDDLRQALCITAGTDIRPSDLRKKAYNRLIEIDTADHYIEIELTLLTRDNVSSFILTAGMTARVTDPAVFLEEGITNAAERAEKELKQIFEELADEFEPEELREFREAARNEISHFTLTRCGLSLSGGTVNVRGDQKYQEFLQKKKDIARQKELEQVKAEAARQLSGIYADMITAVYSEVADGKITAAEAQRKIKQIKDTDFNVGMQQRDQVLEFFTKMRDAGIATEEELQKQIELLTGGIAIRTEAGRITGPETRGIEKNEENGGDSSIYGPFDDDE